MLKENFTRYAVSVCPPSAARVQARTAPTVSAANAPGPMCVTKFNQLDPSSHLLILPQGEAIA